MQACHSIAVGGNLAATKSRIALADGIALVLEPVVEDIFIANHIEFRVAFPHTFNEIVVVLTCRLQQTVAQLHSRSGKVALVDARCQSVENAVVEVGGHQRSCSIVVVG